MTAPITPSPEMGFLPCPFCGGTSPCEELTKFNWSTVQCIDCGAQGPCIDLDKDKAIKRWNTRDAPALSCPDGFRLVPVEPTDEMVVQGLIGLVDEISRQLEGIEVNEAQQYMTIGAKMRNGREIKAAYRAMLAASPVSLQVKDSK